MRHELHTIANVLYGLDCNGNLGPCIWYQQGLEKVTIELAAGSMLAALMLAVVSLARSGCRRSAICWAVSARLLGRPVLVRAPAPMSAAWASGGATTSGGLKNTGNGDPPIGLPFMSTLNYCRAGTRVSARPCDTNSSL